MSFFKRWIPDQESLSRNRWLGWLAPWLSQPALWVWSRHGVALGVAIGIFFGMLVPVAQLPASALTAIVLRANLPAAAASTFVSNPITFAPVYYMAYRVGASLLNEPVSHESEQDVTQELQEKLNHEQGLGLWERVKLMGKPLFLGLLIFAVGGGLAAYVLISLVWFIHEWIKLRRQG